MELKSDSIFGCLGQAEKRGERSNESNEHFGVSGAFSSEGISKVELYNFECDVEMCGLAACACFCHATFASCSLPVCVVRCTDCHRLLPSESTVGFLTWVSFPNTQMQTLTHTRTLKYAHTNTWTRIDTDAATDTCISE